MDLSAKAIRITLTKIDSSQVLRLNLNQIALNSILITAAAVPLYLYTAKVMAIAMPIPMAMAMANSISPNLHLY